MGRRRKAPSNDDGDGIGRGPFVKKAKVAANQRNRASSFAIVKLYPLLTDGQKAVIKKDLKQGTLLQIKCDQLNNPLLAWLTKLYSAKERAFVIPGRGNIPVNEETVYQLMGLPRGPITVPYFVNYDIEETLVEELFPADGSRPKLTRVAELLSQYKEADAKFKKLWMVYVTCGFLAPTTGTHISNKCYPMLVNVENFGEYNLCKFVADYLHDNLSNGKFNNACLLFALLKYVDSLNCDDYVIDLEEAEFGINKWTREAVDAICLLDAQDSDPNSFGKLELKEEFAAKLEIFGGPAGFQKWLSHNIHPSCTEQDKIKIGSLIFDHAVGLNNLLGTLVQGWSSLGPAGSASMAKVFSDLPGPSKKQPPTSCAQQGKSNMPVEDSTSDSESSTKKTESHDRVISKQILRRSPRNNAPTTRCSPRLNKGNASKKTHTAGSNAASIGAGRENSEDGYGCHDDGYRSSERSDEQDKFASTRMMDSDAGRDDENTQETVEMAGKNIEAPAAGSTSQVIHIPESDASVSETKSAGNTTDILDSQISSQNVDNMIRRDAAAMVSRLSSVKRRASFAVIPEGLKLKHDELKKVVAAELGLLKNSSPPPHAKDVHENLGTPPTAARGPAFHLSGKAYERRVKKVSSRKSPRFQSTGDISLGSSAETQDDITSNEAYLAQQGQGDVAGTVSVEDLGASVINLDGQFPKVVGNAASSDASMEEGRTSVVDGASVKTAIVLSPTHDMNLSTPISTRGIGNHGVPVEGQSASRAIILSPTVRAEENLGKTAVVSNLLPSLLRTPSPHGILPKGNFPLNVDASHVAVSSELQRLVAELSAAVKEKDGAKKGKGPAVDCSSGMGMPINRRPGMFTPPPFHLLTQSSPSSSELDDMNVDNSPDRGDFGQGTSDAICVPPLAWAQNQDFLEKERKEQKLAAYLDGTLEHADDELAEMLDHIETEAIKGHKRFRENEPSNSQDAHEVVLLSATPKPYARKTRVKRASRFKLSPYDETFIVSEDQEDVYKKLMRSVRTSRSSNIKGLDIVKYADTWVYTVDLAESMKPRGQLSTRVCDLAVEYIREHYKVEKRIVVPYLVMESLLKNEFTKKVVLKYFKRQKTYSLTCQNLVVFVILENLGEDDTPVNHWYVIGVNMVAKRFEVLDSLRGPQSVSLINNSGLVVNKIKEAWNVFYETTKNKIDSFGIEIIDVPQQATPDDCGFFMLNNVQWWNGQDIPEMQAHDVEKAKKIWPHRLLSSSLNLTKKWRYHLDNNKM